MSRISGFDRLCLQNLIVKDHLNVNGTAEFRGTTTFTGDAVFKKNPKKIKVPGDAPTLADAFNLIKEQSEKFKDFKIVLKTQGPHEIPASHNYLPVNLLIITGPSIAASMGKYYGHQVGGFDVFANRGQHDSAKAGNGPFSLALSNANKTVTVSGTELDVPYGTFGGTGGYAKAPGLLVGFPNGIAGGAPAFLQGVAPNFGDIFPGDQIIWFDAGMNGTSYHNVVSTSGNSITVDAAIPALSKGSGFSVRPRATIEVSRSVVTPDLVTDGLIRFDGVQIQEKNVGPPIPSKLALFPKNASDMRNCLCHTIIFSISGDFNGLSPNTWMGLSAGPYALLLNNAGGFVYTWGQSYIGPKAGVAGRAGGMGGATCFSLWVRNNIGLDYSGNQATKVDGGEFVNCGVGVLVGESSTVSQPEWFHECGVAIRAKCGSTVNMVDLSYISPGINTPVMVIDGGGTGVGFELSYNSQVCIPKLRMCDMATQATVDGSGEVVGTLAVPTVIPAGYGTNKSGLVLTTTDVSACPP